MLKQLIFAILLHVAIATPNEFRIGKESTSAIQIFIANFENLDKSEQLTNVNAIVDLIMKEIRHNMIEFGYEPLSLPEIHKNFTYKPIIITWHGELLLKKGWAQDVSKFQRTKDAKLDYTNRILSIEVPFKFTQILFNYDYKLKFMGFGPVGGVEGSAKDVEVFFSLAIDFENLVVTLQKFQIEKIGKINFKFTGNALIDWLVNLLTSICTKIFKGVITWIVENTASDVLHKIVEYINNELKHLKPEEFKLFANNGHTIK